MKKHFVIFAAAVAALFASCTKETPNDVPVHGGLVEVEIAASAEALTKTTYSEAGKFSWLKGDEISVWCSDGNYYTFTAQSEGAKTIFKGALPEGVSVSEYAFYPAANHGEDYTYCVPMSKDLSETGSADLPMGALFVDGAFAFKHMTKAALVTFTNFPEDVVAAEIKFVNARMKLSGEFTAYKDGDGILVWSSVASEKASDTNPDPMLVSEEERTYIRKVKVENQTAQVYLPHNGTFWWDYATMVDVIGYTAEGEEVELLKGREMAPYGDDLGELPRGTVIPYAALELPKRVSGNVWEGDNVAVSVNGAEATADTRLKELRAFADAENLYVRLTATNETPFGANYLDYFFTDGEGETAVWWGWTTTGTDIYYQEHKCELDADGNLTKMRWYTDPETRVYVDNYTTEIADTEVIWTITIPREYVDVYKSSTNTVHMSFLLWNGWDEYWAIPARGTAMLEVTLP